ncbi:alpha/beta hydrolase [Brevibacillus parabrevis]|uniref:alpha/beta hydrolase n=1 Tax=Brevibacillus parabrevis TaxID=54914 RepID=UPI0007AC2BDB|nr:alpha/beta fold hydrolase [Brevibacillus parabrevis]KZE54044.1 alpha/beta hydrolase [Brevibacillus parabrevis]
MSTVLIIVASLLLLGILAASAIALHVTWRLTHPVRKPIDMNPEDFGLEAAEAVVFPSRETNISLSGWYHSAARNGRTPNGRTLIFAHGYSQNRQEPHLPALALASKLVQAGYDVLMFDFRNSGESTPALTTIGLREQHDLLGAIDFVAAKHPEQTIGLVGFSMGAATALLVGGRDARIAAVVADSPFYSLSEYLEENLPQWTGLPRFPFNWLILTLSPVFLRANPRHVKPFEIVRQAKKPILFIHGTGDHTVPAENSKRLHALAEDEDSQIWLVPHAGHVRSFALIPDEYAERVIAFLERGMGKTRQNGKTSLWGK